jgi:YgiT-type zinc finger domain-containing protein
MKCERCGGSMLEEQVVVSGGLVKLKNIPAWHCTECKRVEYATMPSLPAQ